MKKLVLPIAIILSMITVYFLSNDFQKNTTQFFGIVDNQEQSVSFQESVKILDVKVIEGQVVEKGSILLSAERNNLKFQKKQLNNQINELDAQQDEVKARIEAQIAVLNSKQKTELASINMQVSQLRSKQQQNRDLYQKILGESPSVQGQDPMQAQINALMQQGQIIRQSIRHQINSLYAQIKASEKPIRARKNQVFDHLSEVNQQEDELIIRAEFSGRIGNISHKQGERIDAFQPVLAVYGLYPKTVKGYIHENVSNNVKIGQQVWIHALSAKNKNRAIAGRVESLGSRIVEYPVRLKKNPRVRSWGREVNIRLPINNTLLLGEKVIVSFSAEMPNTAQTFMEPLVKEAQSLLQ